MRFAGFVTCAFAAAAGGCAAHPVKPAETAAYVTAPSQIAGVWNAVSQTTIQQGMGAGDTRIEKEEWHLVQAGNAITGYYVAALTFVSGDGRPYVCSRQPQFSALLRFNIGGQVHGADVQIEELGQESARQTAHCDPGLRELTRYSGRLEGDVLTLVSGEQRRTLYRIRHPDGADGLLAATGPAPAMADGFEPSPSDGPRAPVSSSAPSDTTDVSGLWVWEHEGLIPGGDEKQEREEWHVSQDGAALSGYYDRTVHQISLDGHAYRCSMAADFQIVTRYRFTGEIRGDHVAIYESSFEVLDPNPCDNGKRRLDAYEGQASPDELRLVWGVGGQVLHRARPDVPTQRF
jgi:hypothetical protein